jgi:hypothetical protein
MRHLVPSRATYCVESMRHCTLQDDVQSTYSILDRVLVKTWFSEQCAGSVQ